MPTLAPRMEITRASCTILVSFKPTEAGQRMVTLKIHNSVTASPDVIALNGFGVRR